MAHLTIISELGFFHSAVMLEFDGVNSRREWYGFRPAQAKHPVGNGMVDTGDREHLINHYIRFATSNRELERAVWRIHLDYGSATYGIGVKDCVSLSADAARECGLRLPLVNMTPFGLIQILRFYNDPTHYDIKPYPWGAG